MAFAASASGVVADKRRIDGGACGGRNRFFRARYFLPSSSRLGDSAVRRGVAAVRIVGGENGGAGRDAAHRRDYCRACVRGVAAASAAVFCRGARNEAGRQNRSRRINFRAVGMRLCKSRTRIGGGRVLRQRRTFGYLSAGFAAAVSLGFGR